MAKKYLTIEEAAELLGVEPSVLSRLREKGEIRAFADRGNWKFREDDVEELVRKRQTDSDPDVPIFNPASSDKSKKDDLGSTLMFDDAKSGGGDSSLDLGSEVGENLGEQPTIVRKGGLDDLMGSDSDVRLVFDDSLMPEPISDTALPSVSPDQSDSDVRLISPGKSSDEGSDSDVKLVPDKAAVRPGGGDGSDSDVALIGTGGDKNDMISLDLEQSDGSFVLGGESSGIALSGSALDDDEDSGITLDLPSDSGIALEAGDSGISFVSGDSGISLDTGSGISLEADDSSLVLAGDSGISLGGPSDSGIALEGLASDSKAKNKSKKPDMGGTVPVIPTLNASDDDMAATTMEVPSLGGEDSEFEFTASSLDDDSSGSVMLGDLDETDTRGKKKGRKQDSDMFDTAATTEFGTDEDEFDSSTDVFEAEDGSDEMEVAEDIIGEDDEISEDVFGAGDEDFDDDMQSGQSSADFVVPSMGAARVSAPVQAEWGGGTFAMLMVSSVVMLLTTFLMYDVVHTMWGNNEPNAGTEMILSSFRGMFG